MSVKYIPVIILFVILAAFIGSIATGGDLLVSLQSDLNKISNWNQVTSEQTFGVLEVPGAVGDFFGALYRITFYQNPIAPDNTAWVYLDWIVGTVRAVIAFGIVLLFFSMVSKALS